MCRSLALNSGVARRLAQAADARFTLTVGGGFVEQEPLHRQHQQLRLVDRVLPAVRHRVRGVRGACACAPALLLLLPRSRIRAAQATAAPAKRTGAARLLAILTTSTFLFTCDVCNAPLGAYAYSHNMSGTPAVVTGKKGSLTKNGVYVMFAGLIIVNVANAVLTITLDDEEVAAAPKAVEEKAAEPAAEAPAAEAAV